MRATNAPAWSGLGRSVQTLVPASPADGTTSPSAAPHPRLLPGGKERRRGEGIRAHDWRRAKDGAVQKADRHPARHGKGEGREYAGQVRPWQERSDTRLRPPADGLTGVRAAPHPDLLPSGKERRRGEGIRAHGWCRAKDGAVQKADRHPARHGINPRPAASAAKVRMRRRNFLPTSILSQPAEALHLFTSLFGGYDVVLIGHLVSVALC